MGRFNESRYSASARIAFLIIFCKEVALQYDLFNGDIRWEHQSKTDKDNLNLKIMSERSHKISILYMKDFVYLLILK